MEKEKSMTSSIKNIVVVASGKGGVGKSTVAVNIAVSLAEKGLKIGLLDADIYGPSIPLMMGLTGEKPNFYVNDEGKEIFVPYEKYGIKVTSVGFYVAPNEALIWRGPMAASVFTQLLEDTDWGPLDYLIIDSPPGTGDIQLSLVQNIGVTGAVIVTTPQQVATVEALKAITMFRKPDIKVPILGIVENMSWFASASHPEEKYFIFGKDGGKKVAEDNHVALLGQVPLIGHICESGDNGKPSIASDDKMYKDVFADISDRLIEMVNIRNSMLKPTEAVKMDPNAEGCTSGSTQPSDK